MPFFGVPIRNGLPIGLGSVAGFGAPQFDPSLLFEGGTVAGTWYDPSDLTTMFTTSAGTTPVAMPGLGAAVSVGRMLDKSGNGNHAIAINDSTARPELRARVNLLTYSEQFDNGAWTKTDSTAANTTATTDPLGGTTSETLTENNNTSSHRAFQEAALSTANVTVTTSISLKANTRTKAVFGVGDNIDFRFYAAIDLIAGTITQSGVANAAAGASLVSAGIFSQGNGWYRVTLTGTIATGQTKYFVNVAISTSDTPGGLPSYLGNGTSGIYIWGADHRPANIGAAVPAYQRIADANTYDTAGFPLYLFFNGLDDGMYTPANLDLSATDKVGVFAGVRKNADVSIICELSANAGSNNGAFLLATGGWGAENGTYARQSRGTATAFAQPAANSYPSPRSDVLTGTSDIAGDSVVLRINGAQVATSATDQGAGNYGTYPLYIGSRANSSLWLNGQIYGLVVVGSAVSAGNISATESWMAGKTGIQI